jgi:hypothetical protein
MARTLPSISPTRPCAVWISMPRNFELLARRVKVGLIAADAVDVLGYHHVKLAALGVAHQREKTSPVDCGSAGNGAVVIGPNHRTAGALSKRATQRNLILDRPLILLVGTEPTINRRPKVILPHDALPYAPFRAAASEVRS